MWDYPEERKLTSDFSPSSSSANDISAGARGKQEWFIWIAHHQCSLTSCHKRPWHPPNQHFRGLKVCWVATSYILLHAFKSFPVFLKSQWAWSEEISVEISHKQLKDFCKDFPPKKTSSFFFPPPVPSVFLCYLFLTSLICFHLWKSYLFNTRFIF